MTNVSTFSRASVARIASHVLTFDVDAPSPYGSMVPCLALVEVVIAAVAERSGMTGERRIAEIEQLHAAKTGKSASRDS